MAITGYKTFTVFQRYNNPSEEDIKVPRTPTTWTDVDGNDQPLSNREVFTTKDGKQFAFPRTIEIGSDIYELDPKSFTYNKASWGGWNAMAYYQNKANPQDRTMCHGLMVK